MQTVREKFEAAVAVAKPLIDAELELAAKHLQNAKNVATSHGVPFASFVTDQVHDTYTPSSFAQKFKGLDEEFTGDEEYFSDFMEELLGLYMDEMSEYGSGWEKSYC